MCRYLYIPLFSLLMLWCLPAGAQTAGDTTSEHKTPKVDSAGHQLCLGIDLARLGANYYYTDRRGYEFHADYYLKNDFYLTAEGGWGDSKVNYTDLKYTASNSFLQAGFNKSILTREGKKDWDMMMIGMRAGFAPINRGAVTYMIADPVWGNTLMQTVGSERYTALWLEVTGGMRVELYKGIMAGWNLRGKFLMNGKSFKDPAPLYIAGYGRGDKATSFVFNVYLSYAIRWERRKG